MASRKSLWMELLEAAANGYVHGPEKKAAADRDAADRHAAEHEERRQNLYKMPWSEAVEPASTSFDDMPNLPLHLKRLPGESDEAQADRIADYLDSRLQTRSAAKSSPRRLGDIYDEDLPGNRVERECGACGGRGKYDGPRGYVPRCQTCNGTGTLRRHIVGR